MSISNIIENNDFKKLIQNISYNSIRFFKDKPSAKLFTIKNTNYCFNLDRKSYKNVLHKCLKDFEKIEDYEKCAECKQLIDTLS